jgi:hypothetical protein
MSMLLLDMVLNIIEDVVECVGDVEVVEKAIGHVEDVAEVVEHVVELVAVDDVVGRTCGRNH